MIDKYADLRAALDDAQSADGDWVMPVIEADTIRALLAERDRLRDALSGLVKALRERHYGRMPDEVQAAYDKAWTIVFSSPVTAPVAAQAQPCDHVYEARPIDGSRRASAPVEAVCRKCGA